MRISRLIATIALAAAMLELAPSHAVITHSATVVRVSISEPTDPAAYLGVQVDDSSTGTAIGAGMPLTLQQPLGTPVASGATDAGGEVTFTWTLATAGDAYVVYDGSSFGATPYSAFGPTKVGTFGTPTTGQPPTPVIPSGSLAPVVSNRSVPRSARVGKRVPVAVGLSSPKVGATFISGTAVIFNGSKQVGSVAVASTENTSVVFRVLLRAGTRRLHAAYLVNGATVSTGPTFVVKVKARRPRAR